MKTKKEVDSKLFELMGGNPYMKRKTQPTPGPWHVGGIMETHGDDMVRVDGPDKLLIALVSDRNLKDESLRDADARFIAAAPDNYEANKDAEAALCDVLDYLEDLHNWKSPQRIDHVRIVEIVGECLENIREAIAKAEGKDHAS